MHRTFTSLLLVLFLGLAGFPALAEESSERQDQKAAIQGVVDRYPNVRVHDGRDHRATDSRVFFYGAPMNDGRTAEQAADAWLRAHAAAFGAQHSELVVERSNQIKRGDAVVFAYEQVIDGMAVEHSRARIIVTAPAREGGVWRVTYAAGASMAAKPTSGFADVQLSGADAVARVGAHENYSDLDQWKTPELVVLPAGGTVVQATRVWKFGGRNSDPVQARSFTFFVDASDGSLVQVRSSIHHEDIDGTITGMATPGLQADGADNAPVETALPGVKIGIVGGDEQFAGDDGTYLFEDLDAEDTDLEVVLEGEWVTVFTAQGSALEATDTVLPTATADFLLNEEEEEFDTAQVNAFIHTQQTHDFFTEYATDYTGIDFAIDCNVNIESACNAFFDDFGPSINFFNAGFSFGTECSNTAFSNVVTHEYGHYIVWTLDLNQNAFGEGYSDSLAILRFNDPIIGEDFFGDGTSVRDIVGANQQYPCIVSQVHACGQILAGVWWDIRLNFEDTLGDEDEALEAVRQLFADWSVTTLGFDGGEFFVSADPGTAIEVLEVNDDNGDIYDGTPDFDDICDAFDDHSIDCPELDNVSIAFPDGLPILLEPDGTTTFTVTFTAVIEDPTDDTAYLAYSTNGGDFETEFLDAPVGDVYTVEIPVETCGDVIDFYIGVEDDSGAETTSPRDTSLEVYTAVVAVEIRTAFEDDFEEAGDWTVGDDEDPDDATTGAWELVDPNGNFVVPSDDHTEDPGTDCWVTEQHDPGDPLGDHDIDGGKTTLNSPLLDLSDEGTYFVSYWRWYSNGAGASPYSDTFFVEISEDGGLSWVEAEAVGPEFGPDTTGGWVFHRFNVADFIEPTDEVIVRFIAADEIPGSLVEAALDDFMVEHYACDDDGVDEFSRGDCNDSGAIDIADPIYLLEVLFGSLGYEAECEDACDGDDDGDLDLPDVFDLLDAVFDGAELPTPFSECGADETDDDDITCESFDSC